MTAGGEPLEDTMFSAAIMAGAISKTFWFLVILVILAVIGVITLLKKATGKR